MNKEKRDELKHKVYSLWCNEKNKDKKNIYKDILDLIDFTDDIRSRLKSVTKLFADML